jgi:hypothetical protein
MLKWLEITLGTILLIVPASLWSTNLFGFGSAALEFLKGGMIWFSLMLGFLFLLLGIIGLKE